MTLPVVFNANGAQGYNLTNSLRFRSSASAYLNRTLTTPTNNKKWTFSCWFKRGKLSTASISLFGQHTDANNRADIYFDSSDNLNFYNLVSGSLAPNPQWITSQVFRDPFAWYHIVIVWDSDNTTASDRIIIYVNGSRITAYSQGGTVSSGQSSQINSAAGHNLGRFQNASGYFDGYMTEINFIDGQALTPSSFGATSPATGVWQPIKYTGTYGTNGFYLPFTDNSALTTSSNTGLGKDFSGNGNYWTTNNISITSGSTYDSMTDVPTLTSATAANYCVLNPLEKSNGSYTFSNANLNVSGSGGISLGAGSTMSVSSGKWYWEQTITAIAASDSANAGIRNIAGNPEASGSFNGGVSGSYIYRSDGAKRNNASSSSYGASFTTNDVIGVALDLDAGTLVFYKNGSSQGTAYSSLSGTFEPMVSGDQSSGTTSYAVNFGQRPFAYTPPTGFVALNTFNLPTPTIGATASSQAGKYFNPVLYTGTGSSQSITGVGFQPDWTWIKGRSGATDYGLYDAVRGVQKQLESNNTDAETTETTGLTAFGSDGFTVGALAQLNTSTATYVAWNWKANGSGSTNTAGSITSTVSANTTAGFSIVTYTGTGSNATVGHGLGVAPSMIIVKRRDAGSSGWSVYFTTLPAGYVLSLQSTNGQANSSNRFTTTLPTSTVFSLGTDSDLNASSGTYVAYCFAEVAGYSKFGSYTGNGSADGPFIFTGFRPRYVMIKRTDAAASWTVLDSARNLYNVTDNGLLPNNNAAEYTGGAAGAIDLLSNGFKARNTDTILNASGGTYIFAAFAESPFKYANAR